MRQHPFDLLSPQDYVRAVSILRGTPKPDLVIAPDGVPYLYRWYIIPRNDYGNIYFHIQVRDDPERPLHDHPWDNMSVILAGGFAEWISRRPADFTDRYTVACYPRRIGETVFRLAEYGHRLELPKGVPYTMTLFSTGPKVRDWGFWYPQGWVPHGDVVRIREDGASIHVHPDGK